jgi:hypothetical protein
MLDSILYRRLPVEIAEWGPAEKALAADLAYGRARSGALLFALGLFGCYKSKCHRIVPSKPGAVDGT